jgi:hypothetical protein
MGLHDEGRGSLRGRGIVGGRGGLRDMPNQQRRTYRPISDPDVHGWQDVCDPRAKGTYHGNGPPYRGRGSYQNGGYQRNERPADPRHNVVRDAPNTSYGRYHNSDRDNNEPVRRQDAVQGSNRDRHYHHNDGGGQNGPVHRQDTAQGSGRNHYPNRGGGNHGRPADHRQTANVKPQAPGITQPVKGSYAAAANGGGSKARDDKVAPHTDAARSESPLQKAIMAVPDEQRQKAVDLVRHIRTVAECDNRIERDLDLFKRQEKTILKSIASLQIISELEPLRIELVVVNRVLMDGIRTKSVELSRAMRETAKQLAIDLVKQLFLAGCKTQMRDIIVGLSKSKDNKLTTKQLFELIEVDPTVLEPEISTLEKAMSAPIRDISGMASGIMNALRVSVAQVLVPDSGVHKTPKNPNHIRPSTDTGNTTGGTGSNALLDTDVGPDSPTGVPAATSPRQAWVDTHIPVGSCTMGALVAGEIQGDTPVEGDLHGREETVADEMAPDDPVVKTRIKAYRAVQLLLRGNEDCDDLFEVTDDDYVCKHCDQSVKFTTRAASALLDKQEALRKHFRTHLCERGIGMTSLFLRNHLEWKNFMYYFGEPEE